MTGQPAHLRARQVNGLPADLVEKQVGNSIAEDVGTGDVNVLLMDAEKQAHARVMTRKDIVVCGRLYVQEVFKQIDPDVEVTWACSDATGMEIQDGDFVESNGVLFEAKGRARSLLTAERIALNFLQFLSGTATATKQYADAISDVPTCKILDTRKTISNFRLPQKYAVQMGGGQNHRTGLYDAFLIKENHIAACDGSIQKAVEKARQIGAEKNIAVEVEVENFKELDEALAAKVDVVMLDNFSLGEMKEAMEKVKALGSGRPAVEASGNVTLETLRDVALTGVDYISIGAITKNVVAADLSMRFLPDSEHQVSMSPMYGA